MSQEMKNSLKSSKVRFIIFKKKTKWYAVALEFNIVEVGKDPDILLLSLLEAISGYVESAIKNNIDPCVLNQKTDKKYEKIWEQLNKPKISTLSKNFPKIYMFGKKQLVNI